MAAPVGTRSIVARKYAEEWPDEPNRPLARKMYKENPALYRDIEDARGVLRLQRGLNGNKKRKVMAGRIVPYTPRDILIPPTYARVARPYVLPLGKKYLICSDLQMPYHDPPAIRTTLAYAQEHGYTDGIVLNGDVIDLKSLGDYTKDFRDRSFKQERECLVAFLKELTKAFPLVVYKGGNHEYRYHRYMAGRAAELLNCRYYSFESCMRLKGMGIKWVDWDTAIYAGKLSIIHGPELKIGGVNPAYKLLQKARECALCSDVHKSDSARGNSLRGTPIVAYTVGCLCGLNPRFAPNNQWNHGFALLDLHTDGWFELQNKSIIKGQVVS